MMKAPGRRTRVSRALLWYLSAISLAAAACGSDSDQGEDLDAELGVGSEVGGSARLPFETLDDWVSYGDAALLVTVASEAEIPATPEELARGEGLVGRRLTVKVDDVIWRHPSSPSPPTAFAFDGYPWELRDGKKLPTAEPGTGWLEVGHQYIVMATRYNPEGWGPINPAAILNVSEGRVPSAPQFPAPYAMSLAGKSSSEVARALERATPNPVAEANHALDPDARWRAVSAAEASTASPPTTS
jgi:hypothetical protein